MYCAEAGLARYAALSTARILERTTAALGFAEEHGWGCIAERPGPSSTSCRKAARLNRHIEAQCSRALMALSKSRVKPQTPPSNEERARSAPLLVLDASSSGAPVGRAGFVGAG
jgi:hypothetical protein